MIQHIDHVRVITNDTPGNAPGDFALVRITAGLIDGYTTLVRDNGWELIGFGYVAKCMRASSYVDLVYRFGGAS